MAMYYCLNRSVCRCCSKSIRTILCNRYVNNNHSKTINIEVDTLDDFTSQLIQKKMTKWNALKSTKEIMNDSGINMRKEKNSDTDISQINVKKINSLFQESIEIGDNSAVLCLTKQCIKYRMCPSLSNLIYVLGLCAQNGDKETIKQIQKLCEEVQLEISKANSHFQHYLAEVVWVKGNISESLKIFKEVYKENAFLRRRIRLIFKYLITDLISKRSEAALINVVRFAEELLADYKDFFPLTCIWQSCFLSDWFTDQCLALELLEKHDGMPRAVISRIPYVVSVSLNSHRTEVVYRLLEILLKYEMNTEYSGVLLALLDYQIRQGDLRSCIEIIQWSERNNVRLPTIYHEKFIMFLLNNSIETPNKEKLKAVNRKNVDTNFKF